MPKRGLCQDYVCINTRIISPEEGATRGPSPAQWRHHVIMMMSLDDLGIEERTRMNRDEMLREMLGKRESRKSGQKK